MRCSANEPASTFCSKRCHIHRELRNAGYYDRVSQAFAVFLPVKSVGVVGDARRYEPVIALRAVETVDFMTARWAHLPYALIERVSNRIVNEIAAVSRVVYDVSSKPPHHRWSKPRIPIANARRRRVEVREDNMTAIRKILLGHYRT